MNDTNYLVIDKDTNTTYLVNKVDIDLIEEVEDRVQWLKSISKSFMNITTNITTGYSNTVAYTSFGEVTYKDVIQKRYTWVIDSPTARVLYGSPVEYTSNPGLYGKF